MYHNISICIPLLIYSDRLFLKSVVLKHSTENFLYQLTAPCHAFQFIKGFYVEDSHGEGCLRNGFTHSSAPRLSSSGLEMFNEELQKLSHIHHYCKSCRTVRILVPCQSLCYQYSAAELHCLILLYAVMSAPLYDTLSISCVRCDIIM